MAAQLCLDSVLVVKAQKTRQKSSVSDINHISRVDSARHVQRAAMLMCLLAFSALLLRVPGVAGQARMAHGGVSNPAWAPPTRPKGF